MVCGAITLVQDYFIQSLASIIESSGSDPLVLARFVQLWQEAAVPVRISCADLARLSGMLGKNNKKLAFGGFKGGWEAVL